MKLLIFLIICNLIALQQSYKLFFGKRNKHRSRKTSPKCNNHGYLFHNTCFCLIKYAGINCEIKNTDLWHDSKYRCNELVDRLDFLYNIDSDHYFNDDDQFSRLNGDSIGKPSSDQEVPHEWIQMHNLTKDFSIFGNQGVTPNDIKQGALGNCYFVAGLASLARVRNGEAIKEAFLTKEDNKNHVYITKWMLNGKPRFVAVDDWIPAFGKIPAFSDIFGDDDFWAIILEKSWAKIYGDYMITQDGNIEKVWEVLTTARTFSFYHFKSDPKMIYRHIKSIIKKDYAVATSTVENRGKKLIQSHAYSVLQAYKVQLQSGDYVRLIQVFNPWNKETWMENPWGDTSENWKKVTNKSIDLNKYDGKFHLQIDDYAYQFGNTFWAEIQKDYDTFWYDVPFVKKDAIYTVQFDAKGLKGRNFYVFIDHVGDRLLKKYKCQKPFQYHRGSLRIYTPDFDKVQGNYYEASAKIKKAIDGHYEVYVRMHQIFEYHKQFTITIYAPKDSIRFLQKQELQKSDNQVKCIKRCSDNGVCNVMTGKCLCYEGWDGEACSIKTNQKCPNDCNGNGKCNERYGRCSCKIGFTGADCQPCQDKKKDCHYWTLRGFCEEDSAHSQYMFENCQISCGKAGYKHFEGCYQEIIKDPCDGINCGYNGKCEKGQCICKQGFYGLFCQYRLNLICKDNFGSRCRTQYKKEDCFNRWSFFMKMGCEKTCGFC